MTNEHNAATDADARAAALEAARKAKRREYNRRYQKQYRIAQMHRKKLALGLYPAPDVTTAHIDAIATSITYVHARLTAVGDLVARTNERLDRIESILQKFPL